ncbi:MAG: ribonuclease III [Chloroflexi bacterium]|nr:ribonuclease III [Chloroflexota bacterium]
MSDGVGDAAAPSRGNLQDLAASRRISVRSPDLLAQALVHRSALNEAPEVGLASNERLEFLGDAIIGYLAAQYLYFTYPEFSEGEMTTVRAALVRADTLARWAQSLDLGRHLRLGRGEEASGGRTRRTLLASAFEAVVAAVALDQGLEAARLVLMRFLEPECRKVVAGQTAKDAKSRLQEAMQSLRQVTPTYRVAETLGPDHDRTFVVEVLADEDVLARASGPSKQEAEQAAAREALARLSR